MATNYPGAVDSFVNPTATDTLNSATVPHAAQHDNINDAMSAVQVTLGVNPQGSSATVVARLNTLDSTVSGKAATNQTMYVGTTALAINRSSASQTLTGVSIDGNAGTVTNGVYTSTTSLPNVTSVNSTTIPASATLLTSSSTLDATKLSGTATINTTGTASNVTGTVLVAKGGTGQTTLTSGQVLIGNGTSGVTTTAVTTTGEADKIVKTTSIGAVTADSLLVGGINDGVISVYNATNSNAQQLKAVSASVASSNYLPVTSGSLVSTGDTGTVTSTMIKDGTIVNDDISASANIASAKLVGTDIATVGTITSGTWNGGVVAGQYGGTGVANTGKTITLGGNLTTSGANATTLTTTGTTSVTLPTSGTLATLAGSETLTNKSISGSTNTLTNIPASAMVNTKTLSRLLSSVSTGAGTSANTFVNIFPTGSAVYTMAADTTYAVKMFLYWSRSATTTSTTLAVKFVASSTLQSISMGSLSMASASVSSSSIGGYVTSTATPTLNVNSVAGNTVTTQVAVVEGFIRSATGGTSTLTPQFASSVALTGSDVVSIAAGSYIELTNLGTGGSIYLPYGSTGWA